MCEACQKGQTAGHAVRTLTLKGRPYQRLWKYGFRCAIPPPMGPPGTALLTVDLLAHFLPEAVTAFTGYTHDLALGMVPG